MRSIASLRRVLFLAAVAVGLTIPATSANAVTFTVDSIGTGSDLAIDGTCDTDATADTDCGLRAAIEEANGTSAADKIAFRGTDSGSDPDDVTFTLSDNRVIGGTLPTITHPLTIDGGDCLPAPDVPLNPCVRLSTGILVDSDGEVAIKGLAFSNAATAIRVIHVAGTVPANPDFQLSGSWFGFDVSGAKQAPPGTAVLLEDVDGAQIGGSTRDQRNLFARQTTGVDILGADDTSVFGNWFGLAPDGSFARTGEGAAANGDAIEVTGSSSPSTDQATGTKIGLASSGTSAAPTCDDFCNTIAGAGRTGAGGGASGAGIDLDGETGDNEIPATGVTIAGNEIGTPAIPNGGAIDVGNADDITIGGPSLAARNIVGANSIGSEAGAANLTIENNVLGGATTFNPPIIANGSGEILDNFIGSGTASIALQLVNTPAPAFVVQGNVIGETPDGSAFASGRNGIVASSSATGNLIGGGGAGDGNTIVNLTSSSPAINTVGIVVGGDDNEVAGNRIGVGTTDLPSPIHEGIRVGGDADDNVIGGATAADGNVVSNIDQGTATVPAAAIRVANQSPAVTSDGNEILQNTGTSNDGLFIDLGEDGAGNVAGGPNGAVQPPSIVTSFPAQATGTAAPNAVVSLYLKSDATPGELASLVAQATADGSGAWTATYPAQPIGQRLTATATSAGDGTSELSAIATVTEEPDPPDTDPPETTIDKAPKDKIKKKTAKYLFSADEAGTTFSCTLDKKPAKPCTSPLKLKRLKPGKHKFTVVASDAAGNVDPTPATDTFKVKRKKRR